MSRLFHKKERHDGVEEPAATVSGAEEIGRAEGDAVVQEEQRKHSKTVAHIGTYPLAQQTKHVLERLPPARVVAANTKPIIVSVLNSKPVGMLRPMTHVADTVLDTSLTVTDKIVPSLKTKTYQRLGEEVMLPYTISRKVVVKSTRTGIHVAHDFVFEPAHQSVLKFRKYYNERFIDTHGKPLIRGSLDFVVGPANRQYERLINRLLPEGKEVPKEGFSNEMDRSVALTINLVARLIPAATKKTSKVVWTPCNYAMHVNHVFNENLDKQENLEWQNSWKATKSALAELNSENIERLKHLIPGRRKPSGPEAQLAPIEQEVLSEQLHSEAPQEQEQHQPLQEAVVVA